MAGLDDALQQWLKQVENLVDLTPEQQAEITGAGAEEYKKILAETTKAKHYSNHDDKTYGHMADNVDYMKKDVDGNKTGVSTIGWNNQYHAMNAMRLNDGTVKISADHFVENVRNSEKTKRAVLEAEAMKYKQLTKKDGDD